MIPEPEPTTAVNPSEESVAALRARPDRSPIIMVNLLRFTPDGGREAYARYGAVASGTVRARGGSVAYTAPVIGGADAGSWDTVTLVRYPRRAAYLDMQSDPAYVGAIPDRTAGLSARLLHPFFEPGGDPEAPFLIARTGGEEVFVVTLWSGSNGSGSSPSGGERVLDLVADMPMVSDARWDGLTVTRYGSVADAEAGTGAATTGGSRETLTLITRP